MNYELRITNRQKGFTLIELLVVIAIIGVLSSLLMANFIGIRQRARDGQRKSDIRQIQSAVELYRADNGLYPDTNTFPIACGENAPFIFEGVTYMKNIPCDPLTDDAYVYVGNASNYCVRSCLENTNDSQISNGSTTCTDLLIPACASPFVNFTVESP